MVSLRSHPRYVADFRALTCGQVAAARAALGLSPGEFADLPGYDPSTVPEWACETIAQVPR